MVDLSTASARLRRIFLRHRRLIAATLAAGAMLAALQVAAPTPPSLAPIVVTAHDLTSGTVLRADDVQVVDAPLGLAPSGAVASVAAVLGETVAGPMRAGEPLTDRSLVGAALIAGYPEGLVATPVHIDDPSVVALLRVGGRIAVYASTGDDQRSAEEVVGDAPVVALPRLEDDTGADGALVVLAVTPAEAARLAQASASAHLSVSLSG